MRALQQIIAGAAVLTLCAPALAQQAPRIDPDQIRRAQEFDPSRLILQNRLQPDQRDQPDYDIGAGYQLNEANNLWYGWVNFDQASAQGLAESRTANLGWRRQAGGVRFATGQREGARIVRCGSGSNSCALPQPGSPDALTAGAGAGTLRIDFAQPVSAVTALVAPDRGFGGEPDIFVMEGWREGELAASTRQQVEIYDSTGQGWTRMTLSGLGQANRATTAAVAPSDVEELDYVIIRGLTANGAATRAPIIIDSLRFADSHGPTPFDSLGPRAGGLQSMLDETARTTGRQPARRDIVRAGGRREGMLYPVAERMRMPVDIGRARAAAVRQRDMVGLDLPLPAGLLDRDPVSLPILAPLAVFSNDDPAAGLADGVRYTGRSDYFHLRFDSDVGRVVISGTRIVIADRQAALAPGQMAVSAGYDGAYASFNLYGASYSVRVSCGAEDIEAPCNDPEALGALLDRLFLWLPVEA